jgi:hypothetical protein
MLIKAGKMVSVIILGLRIDLFLRPGFKMLSRTPEFDS